MPITLFGVGRIFVSFLSSRRTVCVPLLAGVSFELALDRLDGVAAVISARGLLAALLAALLLSLTAHACAIGLRAGVLFADTDFSARLLLFSTGGWRGCVVAVMPYSFLYAIRAPTSAIFDGAGAP